MAIKIPSKHIYSMDNPKIRDNFIDNVKIGVTVVTPNNENNVTVYSEKIIDYDLEDIDRTVESIRSGGMSQTGGGTTTIIGVMGYAKAYEQKRIKKTVYIPIVSNNSYIDNLFLGVDNEGKENIKVNIFGNVESGVTSAQWKATYGNDSEYNDFYITKGEINYEEPTISEITYTTPKTVDVEYSSYMYEIKFSIDTYTGNISTVDKVWVEQNSKEYWKLDLEIPMGLKTETLAGSYNQTIGVFDLLGTYTNYIPQYLEISFNGNKIGIFVEDSTVTYGSGTKPFSLDGNELLQDSATTNGILTSEFLANNILAQYQNGRETATLLCSISDYYDEQGNKVIGIDQDKMSFQNHDLVIPYVFGADLKDKPMSRYSSGKPKVFEVVSTRKFFDGAVWQELNLLEVLENT